mmetsp:Transcript_17977/g.23235  ORF Transcript_17977/g.23235 Transcript_17977/m.23235 type:complete len:389 (-) Transcript_17977:122-1288(-)|eukprot:CAMPEP_0198146606 /NCGR_PEP_ID=MMETSP1443-20131203/30241_1 /TAXON_ID=186043 /ORGANISM="Entomoneis sp., Strain CCMP2396" /LENGTH=388 /DNA_ID=CAMNT_0043810625 /DNA_START=72 /DNA_END=1238 /DNA_ORIENTATION=-
MKQPSLLALLLLPHCISSFVNTQFGRVGSSSRFVELQAAKGFGASSSPKKKTGGKKKDRLSTALNDDGSTTKKKNKINPYVKSEQEDLIASLQAKSLNSCLGQAVASSPLYGTPEADPFWDLMPSLIQSRFPNVPDSALQRVAGFLRSAVNPDAPKTDFDEMGGLRPVEQIHAFMPDLGPTKAFYDASQLEFCRQLTANYPTILDEYHALMKDMEENGTDRFQSVTSMNYKSGWKTLILFYNGHRIQGFPYHLCPVTTRLLDTMPLAGRIAGFNRQQPQTGIPRHTDGNNMWLTCQMGLKVPPNNAASILVGEETRHWEAGECLLYDTTYWHETFNTHETQERVVLHVDFFNTLSMTPVEIQTMEYIYSLREEFMKAEGVSKVGAQIL